MPINGVSEIRRLPRLGKVRLGVKELSKRTGNEFPRAVDFFVVNEDDSTPAWAAQAFHKVYGDKPRSLNIVLPVPDRDTVFEQWRKAYGSGTGKICQGDGQTALRVNTETGEMDEIECDPDECELCKKKQCRRVASLRFLLPEVPGLGVWQWDTTSFNSIVNVNSGLDFVQAVAGRIHMIPLQLVVSPMEVQVEGKKKVVYVGSIGSENIRLSDVARLGQVPVERVFLLDKPDDSKPPDDLFPRSLVESIPPEDDVPAKEPEVLPPEDGPDPLDVQIQEYAETVGWFPAKVKAKLGQYGGDKQKLLQELKAEADGKKPAEQSAPQPKSEPAKSPATSRGRSPASGSAKTQVPPTAPPAQAAFF